jgi:cobalt-zinc-cadmium efflux system protein
MMAVAAIGLVVDIGAFLVLHGAERANLNFRSASLHVLGDELGDLHGSAGAITAAGIILATGQTPIDPLLAIPVSLLNLRGALRAVAQSGHILLEGAPADLDVRDIERDLTANVAEITGVHRLHAWSLIQALPLVTLHVVADAAAAPEAVARAVKSRLRERFGVDHATAKVEHRPLASGN